MRPHGTISRYSNLKCRCRLCTQAWTTNHARLRAERSSGERTPPRRGMMPQAEPKKHGSSAYANWLCRCDVCREGWAELKREQRARGLTG